MTVVAQCAFGPATVTLEEIWKDVFEWGQGGDEIAVMSSTEQGITVQLKPHAAGTQRAQPAQDGHKKDDDDGSGRPEPSPGARVRLVSVRVASNSCAAQQAALFQNRQPRVGTMGDPRPG